jgi:hypothetical protein
MKIAILLLMLLILPVSGCIPPGGVYSDPGYDRGERVCRSCGGSGSCRSCGGTGRFYGRGNTSCSTCSGSGQCIVCNGSGR